MRLLYYRNKILKVCGGFLAAYQIKQEDIDDTCNHIILGIFGYDTKESLLYGLQTSIQ